MTDPGVFAEYASRYADAVQNVIGASGESVAYFAELKARLSRHAVRGVPINQILDFGCGVGNTTRCLASAFRGARVTGFDLSGPSIEAARSLSGVQWPAIDFVEGAGAELPFERDVFDLVFASCVFHHIRSDEQATWVREVCRVLRPGGAFLLFEHNPYNPLTRQVVRDCPFDRGVTLLRPGYARRLLQSAGFRVSRARYYFFFPRILRVLRSVEPLLRWMPMGAQYYAAGWKP